jgi:hypothetical protein
MRKVLLMVVGLAGLALLCGTGELLAQTDTATNAGNTVNGDASDSRLQGMPTRDTGVGSSGASSATSGVGGSGTVGTPETSGTSTTGTTSGVGGSGTSGTGTVGSTGSVPSGSAQPAGGTGTGTAEVQQSVLQLQQDVAQLRQELAQVRTQLDNMSTNTGVGGSGQAGVAPSGSQAGATADSSTNSSGTAQQGAVAGGTSPGAPPRAGTAQETGARSPAGQGLAVVNAIYTGTVRSVSGGHLVLLDEEGKPFSVELGKQTVVLRKGQRISAEELKEGTRVRAVVDMISGHNQAKEVTTLPAK